MTSLYQFKQGQPFHISAGGLVVDDGGRILVHKREKRSAPLQFVDNFAGDREAVYLLSRESVEDGESLAEAALRGVREEFGIEGEILSYLGSIQALIQIEGFGPVEKTTPYFLIRHGRQGEREMDGEGFSVLEWHDPEFLIDNMRGQGGEKRKDLDESKIVETYVRHH